MTEEYLLVKVPIKNKKIQDGAEIEYQIFQNKNVASDISLNIHTTMKRTQITVKPPSAVTAEIETQTAEPETPSDIEPNIKLSSKIDKPIESVSPIVEPEKNKPIESVSPIVEPEKNKPTESVSSMVEPEKNKPTESVSSMVEPKKDKQKESIPKSIVDEYFTKIGDIQKKFDEAVKYYTNNNFPIEYAEKIKQLSNEATPLINSMLEFYKNNNQMYKYQGIIPLKDYFDISRYLKNEHMYGKPTRIALEPITKPDNSKFLRKPKLTNPQPDVRFESTFGGKTRRKNKKHRKTRRRKSGRK